jgi:hypothetical protein
VKKYLCGVVNKEKVGVKKRRKKERVMEEPVVIESEE